MSFHLSAENIHLVGDHILRASLRKEDGEYQDAEIDLNSFLGNEDGMIHWDGRDFSHSAVGASFSIEGEAGVPILRVFLESRSGEEFARDVNLSERIGNNDGEFYYVE